MARRLKAMLYAAQGDPRDIFNAFFGESNPFGGGGGGGRGGGGGGQRMQFGGMGGGGMKGAEGPIRHFRCNHAAARARRQTVRSRLCTSMVAMPDVTAFALGIVLSPPADNCRRNQGGHTPRPANVCCLPLLQELTWAISSEAWAEAWAVWAAWEGWEEEAWEASREGREGADKGKHRHRKSSLRWADWRL